MKNVFHHLLYGFALITGWKWLALIAGMSLLTACTGRSDMKSGSRDSVESIERVTCYEPVADTSRKPVVAADSVAENKAPAEKDSVEKEKLVPLHPCYVPVRPRK